MAMALFVAGSEARAQDISYGVKAGVNLATLSFDPSTIPSLPSNPPIEMNTGTRIGLVAGGFATIPLGARFAVQPEGLFSQKGATLQDPGVDATITINYLEVPILAKYVLAQGDDRTFHVFGGPSIAFKLSAEASAEAGGETIDVDTSDDVETIDFGVVLGGGLDFGRLTLDGRYTFGFSNLSGDSEDPQKARNRVISVMAGIKF
jgi:hypothetical protein